MSHPWYHTTRWRKCSRLFLDQYPLCAMHLELGREVPATVVDHKIPHKGDYDLFWDELNWQPLCGQCHNRHKKIQENRGCLPGCDVDGLPLDSNHHWNNGAEK